MMDHKDFPQMTEEFDRRVRQTLETLPEQPQRARRFPMKRIVSAGLAAALCLGGTAFAASDLPRGHRPDIHPAAAWRGRAAAAGLHRHPRAGHDDGRKR